MLLTADVFEDVTARLRAGPPSGAPGDRREPRTALDTRLTVVPLPEGVNGPHGQPLAVPIRDLSRGGVRFLLPRRLSLGTPFILVLPGPTPAESPATGTESAPAAASPRLLLCAVAWWQPLSRDLFALGAEFNQVLSGIELPEVAPRIVLPGMVGDERRIDEMISFPRRLAS